MPIPKPNKGEKRKDFMNRCMGNPTMNSEFPDSSQRAAVCNTQWKDRNKKMITPEIVMERALLRKGLRDAGGRVTFYVSVCKVDEDKQIVTGEVYAPWIIDSHGDVMEPEAVEQLAHSFMSKSKNEHIDIMHNNRPALAVAIESFIAKSNSEYNEGAWVLSVKIHDPDLWAEVKKGTYNGFSMEALVRKIPALVEVELQNTVFGITEGSEDHDHIFVARIDDKGRVIGGRTSVDNDHSHDISSGTATEAAHEHKHRFFLP